jgi:hypothetical protein
MACYRRAGRALPQCAWRRRRGGSAQLLRLSEGADPTATTRLPLCVVTDSKYCAGKAAHDHILAVDTHINFPSERTTGRSWRRRSHISHITGSCRRAHLSGSRSVYAPPLVYKRESALVRTQREQVHKIHKAQQFHKLSQAIQHSSGRRVLRSGCPNQSESSCLSHVRPPFDQAFLGLPQTFPKLGLGGCIPPPGWIFPPTFGAPGRGI